MKHDEDWLANNDSPDPHELARDYHEHMTRWRSIDTPPEIGQMVIVSWPNAGLKGGRKYKAQTWTNEDVSWMRSYPEECERWKWKSIDLEGAK